MIRCFLPLLVLAAVPPCAAQTDKAPKKDAPTPAPLRPGKDRWLVKTASDEGAHSVNRRPEKTTIEKLRAIPRPADLPLDSTPAKYQNERAGSVEKSIYTVEAEIVQCRLMPDGDYHVVLRGATGETMVLEMPDPDPKFTSPDSPFAYAMKAARERFELKVKPERIAKPLNLHATITGIGFFGRQYGKQPAKGNLIQLHPVVDFEWKEKASPEFAAAREAARKPVPPSSKP